MVFANVFYQLFAVSKWRNEIFVCFLNISFMNDFLFIKLVVQAFLKVLMGHFRMKRYSTNAINNRAISVSVAWVFNRVPIFQLECHAFLSEVRVACVGRLCVMRYRSLTRQPISVWNINISLCFASCGVADRSALIILSFSSSVM